MSLRPTGSYGLVGRGRRVRWSARIFRLAGLLPRGQLQRLGRFAGLGAAWAASFTLGAAQQAGAATGDVLFSDNFESGFGKWSTTSSTFSAINTMTSSSPSRSLYVRGNTVSTTSIAVDTRVPALRVTAWIRRGSDSFSEQPDSGEDLVIEYLDSTGAWVSLGTWTGSGTAGAILALDQTLGGAALHSGFRVRVRLVRGSGGPPDNRGLGWDYWHVDDVVVSEAAASTGLALGRCEEFTGGLSGWTVVTGFGQAHTTGQAVNTATQSLALHGGTVTVTSQSVNLASARDATMSFWLRRGDDRFSEDPDVGEDFYAEYLSSTGTWNRLATYLGDGTPGEIVQPSFTLPGAARHAGFRVRFGMTGRDGPVYDYWHVDSVCLTTQSATAEWRFEEGSWTRTNGEVKDSSGNPFHGRSEGDATTSFADSAIDGNPGTCRHGTFDGNGDGVFLGTGTGIDQSAAATYSAWMQPRTASGTRHVMGMNTDPSVSNRSQMSLYAQDSTLVGRVTTRAGNYTVSTTLPTLDTWTHVALAFDGKSLVLYRNAVAAASTTFADTTLVTNNREFGIGNVPETRNASFLGYLDEARVHAQALGASQIANLMRTTRACTTVSIRFSITHDGSAANCQPESIRVRALDPLGNVVTTYGGMVTITTQSGVGSWSLIRGEGVFSDGTANDGVATYQFDPNDRGDATFALTYGSGAASIDVDVYDAAARDDDTEGRLTFSPSGFLLTANAVPTPVPATVNDPLTTKTAGASFLLYVTAFGAGSSGASCGVIEPYDGNKSLRFWVDALDPTSVPLVPLVNGSAIARSEATSVAQTVAFSRGRATVTVKYKDTGRLALQVLDSTTSTQVRGATGSFVSLPADLKVAAVANAAGDANPGSSTPTGRLFTRAGDPFSVTVDALDAEGSLTPSFGRETTPEGLRLESVALVAPAGGRNGVTDEGIIENATAFTADTPSGRFVGRTFAFDEVGAIQLRASVADSDFLGTGPFLGSPSSVVGRFAPHHFEVTANAPRFATGCGVGAFTWVGQPFGFATGFEATLIVTAVNREGETTANYVDDWLRLTNATLARRTYRTASLAVDVSGLPATTADPAISSHGDGAAILQFSTGTGIALARASAMAPFDAEIELSIDILDADATAYPSNPFRVGGTAAGTGIAFDVSKRFQFGRLRLDNAFGSELVALPMRLRTQRFDGTAFIDDDTDSCSRVPTTALALSPSPSSLVATPSLANVPLFSGNAGLSLAAPRVAGDVDLRVDLGSSGANLPWLRSDWPEDGNLDGVLDDDPRARATFGIWEGRDALIFQRELY
ncbi:LamG domain-containing protein [Myxococcota bacterium]|nr:LamG domain-containing protein [Myxococcota bacterium]